VRPAAEPVVVDPDGVDPYGVEVRRLFKAPAHAGQLEGARRVHREGQGIAVELWMATDGPAIAKLRFLAYGCPHLVAAVEAFCAAYEGRPVTELAAFSAVELCERLPVPAEKTGRILVLEDAVRSLAT
jgi:NifU-like protein involved in Fe-S cluster formation